uniref:Protein-tyrosine-phosphatase n=1 Tax=Syphacia muris TaxID=451379 RepID=A0A0N5AE36_9BILA
MKSKNEQWLCTTSIVLNLLHLVISVQGNRQLPATASAIHSIEEPRIFTNLYMSDDFCLNISINISSTDANATGYRIFYTRTPDEKNSSYGWKRIEFQTAEAQLNVRRNGKHLELSPNSRYIARVAQMRNDSKRRIDEIVEFVTVDEVPDVPTNVSVYIDAEGTYHVVFNTVVDPCNTKSKYLKDYIIQFTTDSGTANTTEWKSHKVEIAEEDLDEYVDVKLEELTISSTFNHSFKVFTNNITSGLSSNITTFVLDIEARKPQITVEGGDNLAYEPSITESINIKCRVVSVPIAVVSWRYKKINFSEKYTTETIKIDDRTVVSTLNISKRIRSQTVECWASNIYGIRNSIINITILGAGSFPTKISAINNKKGVYVSWGPPEIPNGEITGYVIYATEDSSERRLQKWSNYSTSASARSLFVKSCPRQTCYVSVQAVSTSGPGIVSDVVEVPFTEEVIPLNISIELIQYTGNRSTDEAKTIEIGSGTEVAFRCVAYGSPTPNISHFWIDGNLLKEVNNSEAEITEELDLYSFRTGKIVYKMQTSKTLFCEAKNNHESVNTSLFFSVRTQEEDAPLKEWQKFETSKTTLELYRTDVTPSTIYFCKVAGVNRFGEGNCSKAIKFVTGSGAPKSPPEILEPEETNNNVLVLLWNIPINPNGEIKKYTIYYTKDVRLSDDEYRKWNSVEVVSNCSKCTYKMTQERVGLRKDEDYRYRITAWNDLAESEPSAVKLFATLGKEFPVPTKMEATVLKDNSVLLKFDVIRSSQDYSRYVTNFFVSITADSDGIYGSYKKVDATVRFNLKKNQMVLKISGTDLQPNSSYWARARADDPDQNASWSKPVRFQTGPMSKR